MYLKTLRLRGFKSFAEPVELHFERGVSVIVGPNGSGKSNVADGLQWAMASQPPSELRTQVAADVLFGGSARRQPSGLCEVELVLDNEDGTFGTDRPEISVMRRLRRDADAQYLLNRIAVRRLDVQEALADAGLGRELHAIVSQGRVDEILLSRPADRRGFIEEAAGLGKYKRRRHRAAGKLARVEANLSRARDLEAELKARLRPLALQASAAERAAALAGEVDAARIELTSSQIAAARRLRARIAADLEQVGAERTRLDAAIARAATERETIERELAGLVGEQERASERYWGLASGLDRLAARREALAERLTTLAEDRRRALARAERLDAEVAAAKAEEAHAAAAADAHAATLAAAGDGTEEEVLAALVREVAGALDAALAARQELAEIDGRANRAAHDVREASEQALAAGARADALVAEAAARAASRAGLEAALAAADADATAATVALAAAQAAATAARSAAESIREREREARELRGAAAGRSQAATARAEAADRAVERGDGLAPAVRRLRERGVQLALDLVEPGEGLETAVAAALAWRAGEAVAPAAVDAIELLDDSGLQGAALLCLDRLGGRPAPERGRPLASLVTLADDAPAGLLDGINLVDDPADLALVTRGIAVTRDGRGIDADRGLAFRAGSTGTVVLELRRERDEARTDATSAAAAAAAAETEFTAAAAALQDADEHERAARGTVATATRAADEAGRRQRDAMRAADAAGRDEERSAERLAAARDEGVRLAERATAGQVEATALAERRGAVAARAGQLTTAHQEIDLRRGELAETVAVRRADRAAARERADRSRADRDRHAHAADVATRRAASSRARASAIVALEEILPAAVAALAGAAERVEVLRAPERAALERLERRAGELAAAMSAGSEREQVLQRDARTVSGRVTALEVEAAHAEERLGDLVRRRGEIADRAGTPPVERIEPLQADEEATLAHKIERLERRRDQLGAVNPLAQQEYEEAKARHDETSEQIADLEGSLRELRRLIRDLTATITERFDETFTEVERNFAQVITTLFPGGRGRLRLVEPELRLAGEGEEGDPPEIAVASSEPGVELEVTPAGKQITRLAMLSGGEKALAAIAFLFAIMLARPCPFYVLDEVDAALDDANVERFLTLVDRYREQAQFIVITHQKRTMEMADALYGVTMAGDGISKVVSRRLPRDRREAFQPAAT